MIKIVNFELRLVLSLSLFTFKEKLNSKQIKDLLKNCKQMSKKEFFIYLRITFEGLK
jgi:hypothetical protein